MKRAYGVWGVAAAAAIAVSAVSAVAQEDAPRREQRKERPQQAAGAERRGAMAGGMQRGGGMQGAMGRETMLAHFVSNPKTAQRLGLTSNQVAALSEKLDAIQKQKVQVRAELEIAGMEQAKLLAAEKVDEAAIMAAVEKTGSAHTRLAKLEIQPIIELKKVLTPAQVAMAKDMVRERLRDRMAAEGEADAAGPRSGKAEGDRGPMAPPEPPPAPEGEGQ